MARILAAAVLVSSLEAQSWWVARTDGTGFEAALARIEGEGAAQRWVFDIGGRERTVAASELLGLHGAPPRQSPSDRVRLVGGDQYRGVVRAGDPGGEHLVLESPVFGRLQLPVDRLREVYFGAADGARALVLPEGAEADEVLYLRLRDGGRDTVVGTVHQFGERGISFARGDAEDPDRYDYRDLIGLVVGEGLPPEHEGSVWLLTRNGDRVTGDVVGAGQGVLNVRLEGSREVRVPLGEVAALAPRGMDRRYLSDLQPLEVRERGFADDGTGALFPWRPDRSAATGSYLASGGRAHVKGIGAHSRSALTWRVPDGMRTFHAWVGFDRSTTALRLRPDVDVFVLQDDREIFAWRGMRGGDAPRNLGLLPVTPGARLTLIVDFGKGMDLGDRVDWLSAVFLAEPSR